jgi:hypothetical protein
VAVRTLDRSGTGVTNPFVLANIQLADAGPYTVVVTNAFGCTATATVNVVVNPSPVPPIIVSNPGGVLCQGQLYNLSISNPFGPPIVYNWSTGQMGTNINVVLPATYSVTATNQFGCKAPSNAITLHPRPDVSCVPTGCYEYCDECDCNVKDHRSLSPYWQVLVGNVFTFYSASQNLMVPPVESSSDGSESMGRQLNSRWFEFNNCCPLRIQLCVLIRVSTLMIIPARMAAVRERQTLDFRCNSGSQARANGLSWHPILQVHLNLKPFSSARQWCCGNSVSIKVFDDELPE